MADGVYDSDEIAAVKEFQRKNGLTVDGVAGLETQRALFGLNPTAALTPVPSAAAMVTPYVYTTPAPSLQTLKTGSSGELVSALQTRLKALGYYSGAVDGQYGSATAQAVILFQRKNGLTADGVAGAQTLNKLYQSGTAVSAATPAPTPASSASSSASTVKATLLRRGDSGSEVRALQKRLVELGYLSAADGVYGSRTASAVTEFQRRNGLTADGIAGKMTLNRLNSQNAVSASGAPLISAAASSAAAVSKTFVAPAASQVRNANWFSVIRAIARQMPDVVIYDPDSGLHFNLHMFSFGKHADFETPTAADSAVLHRVVGVNSWTPKYVWVVFPDGQVYIASIHSHGHEVDHTPNNDLEGHICLHFPRVMSEAEETGPYAVSHQKEIIWGWELTQAMAK